MTSFAYETNDSRLNRTLKGNNMRSINLVNTKTTYRSYSTYRTSNNFDGMSKLLNDFIIEKKLNPVSVYDNLSDKLVRDSIKKDTKDLSGVYLILNKTTKDYYIGSASTSRLSIRFSNHLINLTGSKLLKLAVRKYGIENFAFIVLETFQEKTTIVNNKHLLDVEDFYLKSLLPNYNILTEAGSTFGYKHTEVDRIKMKANYSEARRKMIGDLNRGKTLSEATTQKLREIAKLRKPRTFSKQALDNMKKTSKSIILYNIDNRTVYGEYPSIKDTALAVGCNEKTVRRALKSPKKVLKKN